MYTIALSGPERTRAQAEVALETARIPILPADHHAPMNWKRKFPDTPGDEAFLTVEHPNVDDAARAVEAAGWVLRVHYPTPEPPQPSPAQVMTATVAELRDEITALKAKIGVAATLAELRDEIDALKAKVGG